MNIELMYNSIDYSTKEINSNFKIKVSGYSNGLKIHSLVGVYGLINLIGVDLTNKLFDKAFNSKKDKYILKLRRGLKITLYSY